MRYFFNLTAFCPDDEEAALICEQQVINTFKKNGLHLYSPVFMQMRNYLAMFPFCAGEGLWDDLKASGATSRAESTQAVNLLPLVADNRLCQSGLLAPPTVTNWPFSIFSTLALATPTTTWRSVAPPGPVRPAWCNPSCAVCSIRAVRSGYLTWGWLQELL